jgi:AcrR family transcriptional regulator
MAPPIKIHADASYIHVQYAQMPRHDVFAWLENRRGKSARLRFAALDARSDTNREMSKAQGSAALQKTAGTADKREMILTSALDLFRHYGYRRTSMEDIARAAAVAKGTLYLYFKSKDELFEAICRSLAEQVGEGVTSAEALDLPLEAKLTALMEAKLGFVYRWILSSPHAAELVDSGSRFSKDVFGEVHDRFHGAVRRLVRQGIETGELDPASLGLTDDAAADALIAAAWGAEKAPDEETFRTQLTAIIRMTLRGLRA